MVDDKIRACVIEDEETARQSLVKALNKLNDFEVVCSDGSVDGGVKAIIENEPQLIFLDIKLFGGDAFLLLDELRRRDFDIPPVVIITGFTKFEYAKKVFNEYKNEVITILEKPFWEDWEIKINSILEKYYESSPVLNTKIYDNKIIINEKNKSLIINTDDIDYFAIRKVKNGLGRLHIYTKTKEYTTNKSLKLLENDLPPNFIRINRYEVLNFNKVYEIDRKSDTVFLKGIKDGFSIGRPYKEPVYVFLGLK
ncbi:MAG TPA: response regulator transcription factor [Bacteroidetes bacterium]|nr:response regulator transcription factor [Bacteroidota bacterium]